MFNDVDLKEIEGHESEKVNKTSIACVAIQTIELKRFYGKIWKEREKDMERYLCINYNFQKEAQNTGYKP